MNKIMQILCYIALSVSTSGCGLSIFADPLTNPVIEDQVGPIFGDEKLATLATTSSRRTITVRLTDIGDGDSVEGMFCAEPSPDTTENIANSVSTALEAAITQPQANLTGEGSIQFAKALATSIESLTKRSQGLLLYRDASYQLCQALLNRAISKAEYKELSKHLLTKSIELVRHELTLTGGNISGIQMRDDLPQTSTDISEEDVNAATNPGGQ